MYLSMLGRGSGLMWAVPEVVKPAVAKPVVSAAFVQREGANLLSRATTGLSELRSLGRLQPLSAFDANLLAVGTQGTTLLAQGLREGSLPKLTKSLPLLTEYFDLDHAMVKSTNELAAGLLSLTPEAAEALGPAIREAQTLAERRAGMPRPYGPPRPYGR